MTQAQFSNWELFLKECSEKTKIKNFFDNPSIYCDGLKAIYEKVTLHLIKNGYDRYEIARVLF
jgi:hypothetical protein